MTEKRKVRIGRLTTVGQVAGELGRLYRQARRGDVAVADASRLTTILAAMRQCLEASEFLDIGLTSCVIQTASWSAMAGAGRGKRVSATR
jgi:hypothetical protein